MTETKKTTKKMAKKVAKKATKKVARKASTTVTNKAAIKQDRVAIVSGLRTPFLKVGTGFAEVPARTLGAALTSELVQQADLDKKLVELAVFGQVVMSPNAPNLAREIVMATNLPVECDAYSVSRACASSYQSVVDVVQNIQCGNVEVGIAGGADVSSQSAISVNKKMTEAMVKMNFAKTPMQKFRAFKGISIKDLMPSSPSIKEPSSEYTMGEAAEKMAKENGITRAEQDKVAHNSHTNTTAAWENGWFDEQVMDVILPPKYKAVSKDNLFRANSELDKYAKLKPVFDRKHGSVTAANSSPLTDGASAVLLMKESVAKSLGYTPLGYIKSYAFTAVDPNWQMLIGPSFATPLALDRAGLTLKDIDLIDMHEAFASQVLSNTQAFESKEFAKKYLNRSQAIGTIDWDKFNITGSSISIGHPFAATGTRQLTQILHDLKRTGGQHGLITACASGGLGAAMIVETA